MTKLKAFAVDKLNINKMTISLLDRVENTEVKGENAGYQHFLLSLSVFQGLLLWGREKLGMCGKELTKQHMNKNSGA